MLCDDALREFVIDDDVTQPLKRVAYTSCCCVISHADGRRAELELGSGGMQRWKETADRVWAYSEFCSSGRSDGSRSKSSSGSRSVPPLVVQSTRWWPPHRRSLRQTASAAASDPVIAAERCIAVAAGFAAARRFRAGLLQL